jgi:hypothetical protein
MLKKEKIILFFSIFTLFYILGSFAILILYILF